MSFSHRAQSHTYSVLIISINLTQNNTIKKTVEASGGRSVLKIFYLQLASTPFYHILNTLAVLVSMFLIMIIAEDWVYALCILNPLAVEYTDPNENHTQAKQVSSYNAIDVIDSEKRHTIKYRLMSLWSVQWTLNTQTHPVLSALCQVSKIKWRFCFISTFIRSHWSLVC